MTQPYQFGLGRQFAGHDPRNLGYRSRPLLDALPVVRKTTYWSMPPGWGLPLDQGDSPQCTGFGAAHELADGPVFVPNVDTAFAHRRYARNVEEDKLIGNVFDGGATVGATMTALKKDGLITGYTWNLGVKDTLDSLCAVGPVCLGTVWKSGMFTTTADGLLRVTGDDVGGHFYVLAARVEMHPKWGPGSWMIQSWGAWGTGVPELGLTTGCAFIRDADLAILLADNGESVSPRDFFVLPTVSTVYATATSRVFHTARHPWIRHDRSFESYAFAVVAGLRPCKLCRPT